MTSSYICHSKPMEQPYACLEVIWGELECLLPYLSLLFFVSLALLSYVKDMMAAIIQVICIHTRWWKGNSCYVHSYMIMDWKYLCIDSIWFVLMNYELCLCQRTRYMSDFLMWILCSGDVTDIYLRHFLNDW